MKHVPVVRYVYRGETERNKVFHLNHSTYPKLGEEYSLKKLEVWYQKQKYCFSFKINNDLVSYYRDLPNLYWSKIYLNYGFSNGLNSTLIPLLKKNLAPFNELEQLQFILNFVEQSTRHKSDLDDNGIETWLFPEEVLASQYSDCEDKSILFAYLVDALLGLKIVIFNYGLDSDVGHANVGVNVKYWGQKKLDFYLYKGEKYIICDPSGIVESNR